MIQLKAPARCATEYSYSKTPSWAFTSTSAKSVVTKYVDLWKKKRTKR